MLRLIAQKTDSPKMVPLIEEVPMFGIRNPDCRGKRSAGKVAKGRYRTGIPFIPKVV